MSDQRGKKRRRADTEPTRDLPSAFNNVSKYPLRASGSDQLFDVFIKRGAYWTIFDRITSFLPIGDIHVLRRTCQAAAPIYDELLKSQWNIDNRLRRFFKNPTGFREVLGECDAVISGSFALQFFGKQLCSGLILYICYIAIFQLTHSPWP
jgi:hypothetical protein